MRALEKYRDKRILIWGYGREGKSTEEFFKKHPVAASVDIFEGKSDEVDWDGYDYVFKSPGIRLEHAIREQFQPGEPILSKLTSQTELFVEAFRDRVVGITGTKGKSTTTCLLHHVLKTCFEAGSQQSDGSAGMVGGSEAGADGSKQSSNYRTVFLVGNIGVPCLDYFDEMAEGDAVAVFEMSCHQLAYMSISPHIALFLNLYEDHLDFYGDRETYFRAKRHITDFQTSDDYLYIGVDVPELRGGASTTEDVNNPARVVSEHPELHVNAHISQVSERYTGEMKLLGEHNRYNASFVYHVATERFGLDPQSVEQAIADFTGLPHRLQFIGEVGGVKYYDDSISTIPEATIQAAESVPDVATILVGGMDREIDYTPLIRFIPEHLDITFICMYESGRRVFAETEKYSGACYDNTVSSDTETDGSSDAKRSQACSNLYLVTDLSAAVDLAKKLTQGGKACVLSPAAASYGYFKNFEERGDAFQAFVMS